MLQLACVIVFMLESTRAAFWKNLQVEGVGAVNEDRKSMDLHLEISSNLNTAGPITHPTSLTPSGENTATWAPQHQTRDSSKYGRVGFGFESADQFLKSALEYHNKLRAIHKSPPLRIDKQMSKEAEEFAKMLAQDGVNLQPTMNQDQLLLQEKNEGQNLASRGEKVGELTAKDAVKHWYDEVCSYNWEKGGYEPRAVHFMQVVWKGTTELGVGKATGRKNGLPHTYIVARYKPAMTMDASNNVYKGVFNFSYCRNIHASSKSNIRKGKLSTRVAGKHFERRPAYLTKNKETFLTAPVYTTKNTQVSVHNKVQNQPNSARRIPQLNYQKYMNDFFGKGNGYQYRPPGSQTEELIYYDTNPWMARNNNGSPTTAASEYYPKQAEVLEEFIEGNDSDRRQYRGSNNIYEGATGSSENLIPVMNSEDAEVDDVPVEDDVERKALVPVLGR